MSKNVKMGRGSMKKAGILVCAVLALSLFAGCGKDEFVDPYEGMVQVESGLGTQMWVELYEELPANSISAADFTDGKYTGTAYKAEYGIDVSEHQGEIDWAAAAQDTDFAIIRAGYRGYSKGGLFEDNWFRANMDGAISEGLDIGVYFFSQATSVEEAQEEAEYLLALLADYPREAVSLPVFFDWETIAQEEARTDNVGGTLLTDCALAFCARMEEAGYDAGIYAYRALGYYSYELPRIAGYDWWIAAINNYPDFYYAHEFWQCSITGSVAGIDGDVDKNVRFVPLEPAVTEAHGN